MNLSKQNLAHSLTSSFSLWFFIVCLLVTAFVGRNADLTVVIEKNALDPEQVEKRLAETDGTVVLSEADSTLLPLLGAPPEAMPETTSEIIRVSSEGEPTQFFELTALSHRGFWSLFPAFVTIVLCFVNREPITALAGGIIIGGVLLGQFDLAGDVLKTGLSTTSAAIVIILYLLFLGGLLGMWSRNGGALAFAEWITERFVRGPKTAKLASWALGLVFFQGGTISTLLVGTTVKPIADKEKISHEELSYIVDSTASPIAVILPFNAWPLYVQSLIFVGGVGVLATEADRVGFFFSSIHLSFYAIFAVLFTFLISIDKLPFIGGTFRKAIRRSRDTGELDAPGARPLQSKVTDGLKIPKGYQPVPWEFLLPVLLIIGIAIGTFVIQGSPDVLSAFGISLVVAFLISRFRGMPLRELVDGFQSGLQSVVGGAVILLLAVVIGDLSSRTGGGLFLVEVIGDGIPYWALPAALFVITLIIAFATGTSWGTFAVAFPLVMPLAWAVGQAHGVSDPVFFLQICFITVINGSVFGDQCSPVSDTTILSSLATGCDLMDHVRTQIVPCAFAGLFAVVGWTLLAAFMA